VYFIGGPISPTLLPLTGQVLLPTSTGFTSADAIDAVCWAKVKLDDNKITP